MLIDLLRRAAERAPERPVVLSAGRSLSYAECVARAEAVAGGLAARGVDRFAVAVADPADAVVALAASTAVGAEACLYPRGLDPRRVGELAGALDHGTLVADAGGAPAARSAVTLEELTAAGGGASDAEPVGYPVLVLTTGTTGAAKGVRHDWARLVRRSRATSRPRDARWLLAHDLHQFAGLQVLLQVVAEGATLVVPEARGPREALAEIRRHRVTHVSATPTFWRLLVGSIAPAESADLPLVQITLGGEAAPEGLLRRLRALFPGARISHVYAGTEFGSVVSVSDGHAGLPASVLERPEHSDVRVRIADGELEVRSREAMLGYHRGSDRREEWLRTGDLVELRDGRIHFVGRRSEVVNVGGAKVHPLPLEDLAGSVEGVALAVAYGRPNPVTGQIVALDVVASPGADPAVVETAIRAACEELPRPARPQRIRFVDEIETRGNKLVRRAGGERS